jgi:hypothetical protein
MFLEYLICARLGTRLWGQSRKKNKQNSPSCEADGLAREVETKPLSQMEVF